MRPLVNTTLRNSRDRGWSAFTLIEVLAVTILMASAVAMVTVRMHTFSDKARLDAACTQVSGFESQLRTLAQADGLPRLLTFTPGQTHCSVNALRFTGDRVMWGEAQRLEWVGGVALAACAPSSPNSSASDGGECVIRISGDGRSTDYSLVLRTGEISRGLAVAGRTGRTVQVDSDPFDAASVLRTLQDQEQCPGTPQNQNSASAP